MKFWKRLTEMNGSLYNNDKVYNNCLNLYRVTFSDGETRYTQAKNKFNAEMNTARFDDNDEEIDIVSVELLESYKLNISKNLAESCSPQDKVGTYNHPTEHRWVKNGINWIWYFADSEDEAWKYAYELTRADELPDWYITPPPKRDDSFEEQRLWGFRIHKSDIKENTGGRYMKIKKLNEGNLNINSGRISTIENDVFAYVNKIVSDAVDDMLSTTFDNFVFILHERFPQYDVDWCAEEVTESYQKAIDDIKLRLTKAEMNVLFANK